MMTVQKFSREFQERTHRPSILCLASTSLKFEDYGKTFLACKNSKKYVLGSPSLKNWSQPCKIPPAPRHTHSLFHNTELLFLVHHRATFLSNSTNWLYYKLYPSLIPISVGLQYSYCFQEQNIASLSLLESNQANQRSDKEETSKEQEQGTQSQMQKTLVDRGEDE